jgi:hypothetical protein
LGIDNVPIKCAGRQTRGSNECGLHTIVNAWKEALGVEVKEHDGELRLAHLRTIFARWANNPPLARKHAASIARDPTTTPNEESAEPRQATANTTVTGGGERGSTNQQRRARYARKPGMCALDAALRAIDYARGQQSGERTRREAWNHCYDLIDDLVLDDDVSFYIGEFARKWWPAVRIWDKRRGGRLPEAPYIAVNI